MRELAAVHASVAREEARGANSLRPGVVTHVDVSNPAAPRVRLRLGGTEAEPFLSPWVPFGQSAGALKLHSPQQMVLHAPSGVWEQGYAQPLGFSQAQPSPSSSADEHVLTFGEVRIELGLDRLEFQVGPAARLRLWADGRVEIEGAS